MKFCFGTVCWNGYLERYIDTFTSNYITIYKKLVAFDVAYEDIAEPRIVYNNDEPKEKVENAIKKIETVTGKKLILIHDKRTFTNNTIMYLIRNRLRSEFEKTYPTEKKVFFYFPIDDRVRPELAFELLKLSRATVPTACMFKFLVMEKFRKFTAATRPINSYTNIHPGDWGGYCAYTIFDKCPLYPKIAIPNVAFYIELFKAGYVQYASQNVCVDHLRHLDSHHFIYKDTAMTERVKEYLLEQRNKLQKEGYK